MLLYFWLMDESQEKVSKNFLKRAWVIFHPEIWINKYYVANTIEKNENILYKNEIPVHLMIMRIWEMKCV